MSGHSKWATIHRQKEVSDQKRGQIFTKISNAITVSVRDGGGIGDPELNFKLRLAMEKARSVNMPKENMQRAIDRGMGKGGEEGITEVSYEGYGPGGVGIIVETATDNRQSTVQELKNIFDRGGGSIASPGSVVFNFKKIGWLQVGFSGSADEAMLKIIDLGAEDVEEGEEGTLEVYASPDLLAEFKEKLSAAGFEPKTFEIIMKPVNLVPVRDQKTADRILDLLDKIEALDDVLKVYANFEYK